MRVAKDKIVKDTGADVAQATPAAAEVPKKRGVKAQRGAAPAPDKSERAQKPREASPASSTPGTSLPEWVDLSAMRLVNAVVLGKRGAPIEQCGFNATFMTAGGQMLSVHQPPMLPDVTSREAPKPAFVNVIPGRSQPVDLRTPEGRAALSVEIKLADVAPQITHFLASFQPGAGNDAAIVKLLLEQAGKLANAKLGSFEEQAKVSDQAAKAYDKGDFATARVALTSLLGSGYPGMRAHVNYMLGEIYKREQDYPAALRHLGQAKYEAASALLIQVHLTIAGVHRGLRDFDKALVAATDAATLAESLAGEVSPAVRARAYFQQAVMEKNLGRYAEAAATMQRALWLNSDNVPTVLACAGYLCLAGAKEEGDALFARIPVPQGGTTAIVDYGMNAAWFSAVKGDDAAALTWLGRAADAAVKNRVGSFLTQYMATEADFDRLRAKPEFQKIMESLKR